MDEGIKPQFNARKNIILTLLALTGVGTFVYFFFPDPIDWTLFFRPAALLIASGGSPYGGSFDIYNPPWALIPLIPFAYLPYRLSVACLFVANLVGFVFVGLRLGAKPLSLGALIASFPVAFSLLFGQIDALVYLGLVLPRAIGLFFILAKPQIGAPLAFFWMVEAWRAGGWKNVLNTFAPVTAGFFLSFLIYGFWPLNSRPAELVNVLHNTSFWPLSLALGLPLLIYAMRSRRQNFAMISGPLFSPYVAPQSWSISLLGLLPYPMIMVVASLASWGLLIYRLIR